MASSSTIFSTNLLLFSLISSLIIAYASNFYQYFIITFGDGRAQIFNNGEELTLSLDKYSGSGFQSLNEYLYGKLEMQIKLVPGNSAGTVTTFYLRSEGSAWDEIDFEFLGNLSGDPYIIHTNVFSQGIGNKEQQFHLWFDPTADFHTYSILWNPERIVFYVDGTPLREYKNIGIAFPTNKPMRLISTLWNADDWATRGGLVKTDWSKAPFIASYKNFTGNSCFWSSSSKQSYCGADKNWWYYEKLDLEGQKKLKWVQKNHMIYNYCTDTKRFPQGIPPECRAAA